MSKEYYSTTEFSKLTGMHRKVVYKNINAGRIRAYRTSNGSSRYLIAASEVANFARRQFPEVANA